MPASELINPDDQDATGAKVRYLYCPDCSEYSGGGHCRRCELGLGDFVPPSGEPARFVAIVCHRDGQGCEVVSLPKASSAAEAREKRQEALL